MKVKLFLFTALFALMSLTSCNKKDSDTGISGFDFGQNFELSFDRTATASDGTVEVRFKSVESDSRCPSSVDCFWEGEATIALTVTVDNTAAEIMLSTHRDFGQVDTIDQHIFTLVSLAPYPNGSEVLNEEDYSAELRVEKL